MNWLKDLISGELERRQKYESDRKKAMETIHPIVYWQFGTEIKVLLDVPKGIFINKQV